MSRVENRELEQRALLRNAAEMTRIDEYALRRHAAGELEVLEALSRAERVGFRFGRMSLRDVELTTEALKQARPELSLIAWDDFVIPSSSEWQSLLEPHRGDIRRAIGAVGRIEVGGRSPPPGADEISIGTGFAINSRAILTAGHIVREICDENGAIRSGLAPRFDPVEEAGRDPDASIPIERGVRGIGLDYGVLFLSGSISTTLELATSRNAVSWDGSSAFVYSIGYPGIPGQTSTAALGSAIGKKRLALGELRTIERQYLSGWEGLIDSVLMSSYPSHRGSSGSPVVDLRSGVVLGIHVQGNGFEADAVPAWTIRDRVLAAI